MREIKKTAENFDYVRQDQQKSSREAAAKTMVVGIAWIGMYLDPDTHLNHKKILDQLTTYEISDYTQIGNTTWKHLKQHAM